MQISSLNIAGLVDCYTRSSQSNFTRLKVYLKRRLVEELVLELRVCRGYAEVRAERRESGRAAYDSQREER